MRQRQGLLRVRLVLMTFCTEHPPSIGEKVQQAKVNLEVVGMAYDSLDLS